MWRVMFLSSGPAADRRGCASSAGSAAGKGGASVRRTIVAIGLLATPLAASGGPAEAAVPAVARRAQHADRHGLRSIGDREHAWKEVPPMHAFGLAGRSP